jgi:DNA-binding transcriptional ArsR family regulator
MEKELLEKVTEFFKALSDPTRLKIINILTQGEMCVCCITEELQMTQSAVSHQLRVLREKRIIKARREGKNIYYSLDDDHVKNIIEQTIKHHKH